MRVKRYVVDSMPEALQKIRHDLGKDAVILNTKEIRKGGFFGLFAKRKIEVIAAVDEMKKVHSPKASREGINDPPLSGVKEPSPPQYSVQEAKGYSAKPEASLSYQSPLMAPSRDFNAGDSGPKGPDGQGEKAEKEDLILKELKKMKEIVRHLSMFQLQSPDPGVPSYLKPLEQRLLDQGVEPEILKKLFQKISLQIADNLSEEQKKALAFREAGNQIKQMLTSRRPKTISPDVRICHFVGPTGVGKTTTIAKLAAEQVLKFNRKVGFITSDTYRIAAVEQLRTYAGILNVPMQVVVSPHEMNKALNELKECDLILMDTAGRNYRNEMYVSELNSLFKSDAHSETFLVLSLTTKYKDMKEITGNFLKFHLDKVLFTKMDETSTFGSILNFAHDFRIPFSYITNGQNVPDDIQVLDENQITELILGDRLDE